MSPNDEMTPEDRARLAAAKRTLQGTSLAVRLAHAVGAPVEYLLDKQLPGWARSGVDRATRAAVERACAVALKTLRRQSVAIDPHTGLHRLAVGATGAAGGFFGVAGTLVELPVTTAAMLRSILAIARTHGEPMAAPETRLACLEVLALGGESKHDDAADTGYFAVRAALAGQVTAAVNHLAGGHLADRGAPVIVGLVSRVAAFFAVPVSEKLAAQAIPVIGAVSGATLNMVFMQHFQRMAEGHFTVRELERRYGADRVREIYRALRPETVGTPLPIEHGDGSLSDL